MRGRLFLLFFVVLMGCYGVQAQVVGSTKFDIYTNDHGGLQCDIPLLFPDGTANMTPQLTLSYNSQSGIGLAGYGWDISGLSVIGRVGKNLYFDNKISAVTMDTSDRFALDGQRLIVLNNKKYGSEGCVYGTEEETYIRVESHNLGANYPQYFLATSDDGSVAKYSSSEASFRYHWYIDSVADKNGNYILYHYKSLGNNILIDSISYTGNHYVNLKPYNSIIFQYDTIPNIAQIQYVGGLRVVQQTILKSVLIKHKGEIVKTYILQYSSFGSFYPRLVQVQEFGADNNYYPPLFFQYVTVSNSYYNWQGIHSAQSSSVQRVLSGCFFNNDTNSILRIWVANNRILLHDTNDNHGLTIGPWTHPYGGYYTNITFNAISCDADVSNTDEVLINVAISTQSNYKYDKGMAYWCRYEGNSWVSYLLPENTNPEQVLFGNFDDNPALDYIYVQNGMVYVYPNFCNPQSNSSYARISVGEKEKLEAIDIDGDGQMELLIIHPQNGGRIYKNSTSININFNLHQSNISKLSFDTTTRAHLYFGDVNGDGITDLFTRCQRYNDTPYFYIDTVWGVYLGTGNGFSTTSFPVAEIPQNLPSPNNVLFQLIDINGDGKDDIVYIYESNNGSSSIQIYLTLGFSIGNITQNYLYTEQYHINSSLLSNKLPHVPLMFSDGDRDGIVDITWVCNDGKLKGITRGAYQRCFLTKITDCLSNLYTIEYKAKRVRTKIKTNLNTIYCGIRTNLILATSFSKKQANSAETILFNKHYTYQYPLYDHSRGAFLGFGKTTCEDNVLNYREETIYQYNDMYHRLLLSSYKKEVLFGDVIFNNNEISNYNYFCHIQPLPNGLCKMLQDSMVLIDNGLMKNICNKIDYTNGRLIETTTSMKGQWAEQYKYDYGQVSLSDGRQLTKVLQEIHSRQIGNSALWLKDTTMYIYTNGDLCEKQQYQGGNVFKTYRTYHPIYGVTTSESFGNEAYRAEYYDYDTLYRFITTLRKAYNQVERWTFEPKFGNPLTYTDINNNTTTYTYDGFGRTKSVIYPDGSSEQYAYVLGSMWGISNPDIKYCIWSRKNGAIYSTSYFDAVGNEILTKKYDRFIQKEYDPQGRLIAQSTPYTAEDTSKQWTFFTYNAMDLLEREKSPYTHLHYSYQIQDSMFLITTVYDSLRNTYFSKKTDGIGHIHESSIGNSQDNNENTLNFSYLSAQQNGKAMINTIIENSVGFYDTLKTDVRNRQITTFDTDAGATFTSYNCFDEIETYTDANGNMSNYQYDSLGRVTHINIENDTNSKDIYYTYDANGIKGVLSEETYGNTTIFYKHDSLGRLKEKIYVVENDSFRYHYTYNQIGQLATMSYPSGLTLSYTYTQFSQIKEIKIGDTSIYNVLDWNRALQRPVFYQLGQKQGVKLAYNKTGQTTSKKAGQGIESIFIDDGGVVIEDPGIIIGLGIPPDIGTNTIIVEDEGDMPIPLQTSFDLSDSSIMHHYYSYDNVGRLIEIKNVSPQYFFTVPLEIIGTQDKEYFSYDIFDRLTSNRRSHLFFRPIESPWGTMYMEELEEDTLMNFQYEHTRMTRNSSVGDFYYANNKAHAISSIIPVNDTVISENICAITYNLFDKTNTITEENLRYTIDYYANKQRSKTKLYQDNLLMEEKIYCGREYEKNLTTNTHYNYIYVGNEPIAVYIQNDSNRLYYLYTNHNGSIEKITNTKGDVVDAMSYTPFGKRRMSANWHYNDTAKHLIDRGFTGQQHLDNFALINFNGRMYDPVLAHFLSPDPYIQSPENPLNHNRYSYCLFSPLQYVDPSGEMYNPIFDWQGNFLGTDDRGIQGEAIIMNKWDFVQNMSHEEALKKGIRRSDLPDIMFELMNKIDAQTSTFPNRPDWDGVVTREEGIAWAKAHPYALKNPTPENTLYIDAALLDFGNISISNFINGVGKSSPIQTLTHKNFINGLFFNERIQNTVYALGRVNLILLNQLGDVRVVNDNATDYDWNTGGGVVRNALIQMERKLNNLNDTHGFKTFYYGKGKVNK